MPWPSPVTSPTRCRSDRRSTRPPRHSAGSTRWSTPPASAPWPDWPTPMPATWRTLFDTNVIGASLVTAAALPHLAASNGVAAYLSSTSASLTPAFPGLGAYAVSKAALNKLVEAWRGEHPGVGFTQVTVGDCAGGDGRLDDRVRQRLGPRSWPSRWAPSGATRQYIVGIVAGGGGTGQRGRHRPALRSQRLHPRRRRRPATSELRPPQNRVLSERGSSSRAGRDLSPPPRCPRAGVAAPADPGGARVGVAEPRVAHFRGNGILLDQQRQYRRSGRSADGGSRG